MIFGETEEKRKRFWPSLGKNSVVGYNDNNDRFAPNADEKRGKAQPSVAFPGLSKNAPVGCAS